jgi:hypothetical protein
MITVRLLAFFAVLAMAASAAASNAERYESAPHALLLSAAATLVEPKPLRGVPLRGPTGLRLLVADDPPFVLDVDTGHIARVTGLNARGNPVLSVLAVGKDAVVWLDRRTSATKVPSAEIYVVRHGATSASRIATGWDIAPSADGAAIWLKGYTGARHCAVRELALDGRQLRTPRLVPCSTRLIDAGGVALLVQGRSVVDPGTGHALLRGSGVWAMLGHFALTAAGLHGPLTLTDLRSAARWRLLYPSQIGGQGGIDQAAVQRNGELVALSFSDPAYQFSGTQVTDIWLLDTTNRRFHHLPDMPAVVALKFTSMSWTSDGRLVMLAETAQHDVVAVWRPGDKRIAVRPVRLPIRNSGSDAFVVSSDAP